MKTISKSTTNFKIAIAVLGFFITLASWSLASSIGSGGDIDAHISSIWCAWGESPGICEKDTNSTADVPYMFQMCDGRPIDSWPSCETVSTTEKMQTLRIMRDTARSPYYSIMRIFVTTSPAKNILTMRLVNSFIATIILFGILKFTNGRIRLASISGLTLTLIPVAVTKIPSINTQSWAIMGVMSSWVFLSAYLGTPNKTKNKKVLLAFFVFSASLPATSRVDATTYVVFTSAVVLLHHYMQGRRISWRAIITSIGVFILGFAIVMRTERIRGYFSIPKPRGFPSGQYILFQFVHIPESLVEVFGYVVGQQGNGPGLVGIVGLSLYIACWIVALHGVKRNDFAFNALIITFLFVVMYKGSLLLNSLVPLPGTYALGLMTFLLGMSIITSPSEQQFLSHKGNRIAAISLLSITHALTLYSWMELYTQGVGPGFFNAQTLSASSNLSLGGRWWWNSWSSPNWVFLIGVTSFPVFLHYAWRVVNSDLVLRNSSDFNVSNSETILPLISIA